MMENRDKQSTFGGHPIFKPSYVWTSLKEETRRNNGTASYSSFFFGKKFTLFSSHLNVM